MFSSIKLRNLITSTIIKTNITKSFICFVRAKMKFHIHNRTFLILRPYAFFVYSTIPRASVKPC